MIAVETVHIRSSGLKGGGLRESNPGYAPRVEFSYAWQGKTYTSHRFWFGSSLWNVKADVEAVIAPYLPGKPTVCYVDPADPTQAVLTRDVFERREVDQYSVTAIVLVCLTLVGTMVCSVLFLNRHSVKTTAAKTREPINEGSSSPPTWGYVLRAWMLSILWNGVLSTIAYFTWVGGAPISFFIFFLGAFWLIGLIMVVVAVASTIEFIRRKLAG
jgi:hypothetical protein